MPVWGAGWELRVFCTGFLEMLTVIRASRGQRGGGTGRESPRLSFIWFEGVGRAVGGGRETRKKGGGRGEEPTAHTHHPAAPRGDNKLQLKKTSRAHRGTRRGAGRGAAGGPQPRAGLCGSGGVPRRG